MIRPSIAATLAACLALPAAARPDDEDERATALDRAERSVAEAATRVGDDPTRPAFHFRPPAQWMNDPNGTIYLDGFYHLFYQHNPYGDRWGHMHWGHARSKDLVHWEHLPIALWPSESQGEEHVFSGCAAVDGEGRPVLFYTSVGPDRPNEQWAALPIDAGGIGWRKHPDNPLLTVRQPDGTTFGPGMRDPFIFHHDGRTFMVVGADTDAEATIPLYEASDDALADWQYRGIAWRAPKGEMEFPECPNFFPLGDRFVLLLSPYRAVEYRVGTFDPDAPRFEPEATGRLDHSDQFYATNIATAPDGRCIVFGWVRGFPEGLGWNGCLALPRELTLGDDGHPRQRPASELAGLRRKGSRQVVLPADGVPEVVDVRGDLLEVRATFNPGATGERGIIFRGEEEAAIPILARGETLHVAGLDVPLGADEAAGPLVLHAFLDRSVLEVFVNDGRHVVTRVVPALGRQAWVSLQDDRARPEVDRAPFTVEAWVMGPIWDERAE